MRDVRSMEPGRGVQGLLYLPAAQACGETSTFGARTRGHANDLMQAMQPAVSLRQSLSYWPRRVSTGSTDAARRAGM